MIDVAHPRLMARYNRWQNASVYAAAARLDDAARKQPRGAFFGSIHGTLNHILWADQTWMVRLADMAPPRAATIRDSVGMYESWTELAAARESFDAKMLAWADRLQPADLEGDLTWYSGSAGRNVTRPRWVLVVHLFNHQTHHRGQVHTMLVQAGVDPGVTDLPFLPEL